MPTTLPEPTYAFSSEPTDEVVARLLAGRPRVVAVDGRGGAGKSTLGGLVARAVPGAAVVHTDDLQWHEPMFEYHHLLQFVVDEFLAGRGLDWQPPQWTARGRTDRVAMPAGAPLLVVEGCGAGDARVRGVDALVWVHSYDDLARQRGLDRDMAAGEYETRAEGDEFWDAWAADELAHYRVDRPWDRAVLVVDGTAVTAPGTMAVSWPRARG